MSHAAGEAVWELEVASGAVTRAGAYLAVTGFELEEIGPDVSWWRARIHPEDRASVLAAFDAAVSGERRELILLYRFRRKDGSYALLLDRGFALGAGDRIVGFAHEVGAPALPPAEPPATPSAEELYASLEETLEEERQRLARELHDEVGQLLTTLRIMIRSGDSGRDSAEEIVDELFERVRGISAGLRPPMLDDLGLGPALNWHCYRFSEHTGLRVHTIIAGLTHRYPPKVELTVFRVVQEALTNVARHARVEDAWVSVRGTVTEVAGVVIDRGTGFDPSAPAKASARGLPGMRERIRLAGGRLMITSKPGRGTRVFLRIPTTGREKPLPCEVPR